MNVSSLLTKLHLHQAIQVRLVFFMRKAGSYDPAFVFLNNQITTIIDVIHHVNNILQILLIFVLLRRISTNADTTV